MCENARARVCVCTNTSLNGSCVFAQPDGGQGKGLDMKARVGFSRTNCLRQEAIVCPNQAVMRRLQLNFSR